MVALLRAWVSGLRRDLFAEAEHNVLCVFDVTLGGREGGGEGGGAARNTALRWQSTSEDTQRVARAPPVPRQLSVSLPQLAITPASAG